MTSSGGSDAGADAPVTSPGDAAAGSDGSTTRSDGVTSLGGATSSDGSTSSGGATSSGGSTAGVDAAVTSDAGVDGSSNSNLVLYAMSQNNEFGTVDVTTGVFTQVGTLSIQSGSFGDLARLPGGMLYGEQGNQDLVIVDPVTVTSTVVGNTGNSIYAIKFRHDGVLFGASHTDLYTIDTVTANATHVGTFGVPSSSYWDLAFDDQGNLFLTQSSGSLYKVDTITGVATVVGSIGFSVVATDFDNGTLYGFTSDSKIISIDTKTGVGTLQTSENQGTWIWAVAVAGG
jgi:hypothetical protein